MEKEIAALRAGGEPTTIEELLNRPVAETDNAAILLREAANSLDEKSTAWREFDVMVLGLPLMEKEAAAVLRVMQDNKLALAKLREARGKKGVGWQIDPAAPILGRIPGLDEHKSLANLAAEAILLEHQQGNDREAVALARDLLAQSDAVEQIPGGLLPHLVGMGISMLACDRIFEIVSDLRAGMKEGEVGPEELRKLTNVLLDESSLRDGLRLAMRVERIHEAKAAQLLSNLSPPPNEEHRSGMAVMEYLGRPFLRRDGWLMVQHTSLMMKWVQESADWPDFRERTKEETKRMNELRQNTRHMLMTILGGHFDKPVQRTFAAMTSRRLAAVALAVRLYEIEHEGRLPARLEELVPKYLPAVPGDLLGSGRKIAYRPDAQRPRVYSVGENGTDEGGSDAPLRPGFDGGRWSEEDLVVDLRRRERKQLD